MAIKKQISMLIIVAAVIISLLGQDRAAVAQQNNGCPSNLANQTLNITRSCFTLTPPKQDDLVDIDALRTKCCSAAQGFNFSCFCASFPVSNGRRLRIHIVKNALKNYEEICGKTIPQLNCLGVRT